MRIVPAQPLFIYIENVEDFVLKFDLELRVADEKFCFKLHHFLTCYVVHIFCGNKELF